jgi:hypothetical protein
MHAGFAARVEFGFQSRIAFLANFIRVGETQTFRRVYPQMNPHRRDRPEEPGPPRLLNHCTARRPLLNERDNLLNGESEWWH